MNVQTNSPKDTLCVKSYFNNSFFTFSVVALLHFGLFLQSDSSCTLISFGCVPFLFQFCSCGEAVTFRSMHVMFPFSPLILSLCHSGFCPPVALSSLSLCLQLWASTHYRIFLLFDPPSVFLCFLCLIYYMAVCLLSCHPFRLPIIGLMSLVGGSGFCSIHSLTCLRCLDSIFHYCFWAKWSSFSDAKIVCSWERPTASANGVFAQIFLYQAQVCRKAKIKSICALSLACPLNSTYFLMQRKIDV